MEYILQKTRYAAKAPCCVGSPPEMRQVYSTCAACMMKTNISVIITIILLLLHYYMLLLSRKSTNRSKVSRVGSGHSLHLAASVLGDVQRICVALARGLCPSNFPA